MTNSGNVIEASRKANKKTIILLAILVLLAFTFARAFAQPQTQPEDLKPLRHASQFSSSIASSFDVDLNNHDSAAALALFADGAIVSDLSNIACLPGPPPFCQGSNVFVTKTQIRGWLEQLVSINVQLNETQTFHMSGNNVSWAVDVSVDEYRRLGVAPLEANVNAVVENGKFSSFSIELTAESTGKLSSAYATNRASPYSVMAGGLAFGVFFLGLIFPAVGVYYISRVKRLFATAPGLDKPWVLLGAGVGALFVSVLLVLLRDVTGISARIVDPFFGVTLTICAFLVMSSMILMKRVMLGESDE
jgi:hypothetical protein